MHKKTASISFITIDIKRVVMIHDYNNYLWLSKNVAKNTNNKTNDNASESNIPLPPFQERFFNITVFVPVNASVNVVSINDVLPWRL